MKIRKATVEDVVRMAEIFVFNNRVNFYPIFKDINYSFRELNVLSVALEYKKDIYSYYVYEDEILKGFIKINGIEIEKQAVDMGCVLSTFTKTLKEKKSKGEVLESWYVVKYVFTFNDVKEPMTYLKSIDYNMMDTIEEDLPWQM